MKHEPKGTVAFVPNPRIDIEYAFKSKTGMSVLEFVQAMHQNRGGIMDKIKKKRCPARHLCAVKPQMKITTISIPQNAGYVKERGK